MHTGNVIFCNVQQSEKIIGFKVRSLAISMNCFMSEGLLCYHLQKFCQNSSVNLSLILLICQPQNDAKTQHLWWRQIIYEQHALTLLQPHNLDSDHLDLGNSWSDLFLGLFLWCTIISRYKKNTAISPFRRYAQQKLLLKTNKYDIVLFNLVIPHLEIRACDWSK